MSDKGKRKSIVCHADNCDEEFESDIKGYIGFRQAYLNAGWKMRYDDQGTYYYCPDHDSEDRPLRTEKRTAYEAVVTLRISGLGTEKVAQWVNETVGHHLEDTLPKLPGDLVTSFEVFRYDPDDPGAKAFPVWPKTVS